LRFAMAIVKKDGRSNFGRGSRSTAGYARRFPAIPAPRTSDRPAWRPPTAVESDAVRREKREPPPHPPHSPWRNRNSARRSVRREAWCQSAVVLLILVVILMIMIPSFPVHVESKYTTQTWRGLLRTGDRAWDAQKHHGIRRIVRLARCRHERFATQIPSDRIQTMDARFARALVAGALVGTCNIRSLVRPALVSEMNSRTVAVTTIVTPVFGGIR
jgi:hypothetical protein